MYLDDWHILKCREGFIVYGNVYENPDFESGTRISTSLIQSITVDDDRFIFQTLNSVYEALFSEMDLNFYDEADWALEKLSTKSGLELFRKAFSQKQTFYN